MTQVHFVTSFAEISRRTRARVVFIVDFNTATVVHAGTWITEVLDALITLHSRLVTFVPELARIWFTQVTLLTVFAFKANRAVTNEAVIAVKTSARVETRIWATRIDIFTMRATVSYCAVAQVSQVIIDLHTHPIMQAGIGVASVSCITACSLVSRDASTSESSPSDNFTAISTMEAGVRSTLVNFLTCWSLESQRAVTHESSTNL